jgi:hypothetical protein
MRKTSVALEPQLHRWVQRALSSLVVLCCTGCGGGDGPFESPAPDTLAAPVARAAEPPADAVSRVEAPSAPAGAAAPSLEPSIVIRRQPSSAQAREGTLARFSVEAEGAGALTYQWLRDERVIEGGTGPVLQLLATQGVHLARISVVVRQGDAVVQSRAAVLHVGAAVR